MLGIEDNAVALAYVLCIASAALCVVYGAIMWNRGDDAIEQEDVRWAEQEKQVEDNL